MNTLARTTATRYTLWLVAAALVPIFVQAHAAHAAPPSRAPRLQVRVYNYASVPAGILQQGERQAAKLYAAAGVQIAWYDCRLHPADAPLAAQCERPLGERDFIVKLLPESMGGKFSLDPGALGFVLPETGGERQRQAFLMYDRIRLLARQQDATPGSVLGEVLGHELGHLLLGPKHSDVGIMRAHWQGRELSPWSPGNFGFTPVQTRRILDAAAASASAD